MGCVGGWQQWVGGAWTDQPTFAVTAFYPYELSGCVLGCSEPSSSIGYTVLAQTSLDPDSFIVSASCAAGYEGSATAIPCTIAADAPAPAYVIAGGIDSYYAGTYVDSGVMCDGKPVYQKSGSIAAIWYNDQYGKWYMGSTAASICTTTAGVK